MPKLHIILTCDGGSGHRSAAEAIQAQALAAGDTYQLINISRAGWFSNWLMDMGSTSTTWWDWAQRTGNIELLRIFTSVRKLSNQLFNVSFKNKSYNLLQNQDDINSYSDVVFHNTQPNNLRDIVSSVARYNREAKEYNHLNPETPRKLIKYINHFTDLPTSQAEMFIEEIGKINVTDLDDAQFELHTRPPILNRGNRSADSPENLDFRYHQKIKKLYPNLYLNLPANTTRVKFVDGPIRPAFLARKNNAAAREEGLSIQFSDEAEFNAINHTLPNQFSAFNLTNARATMAVAENTEVVTIMLGSQASIDGTLGLVKKELESTNESKIKHLYVFCGANKPQEGLVLYGQIMDIATRVNADPTSRVKIIPLTNQPSTMIADVYSMADRVITRPGGISIMEIEAVAKRAQIFLFTELGKLTQLFNSMTFRSSKSLEKQFSKQPSQTRFDDLIDWECGNGLHAQNKCIDNNGRTRIVPINIYTFQNELAFNNKKDNFRQLINNQDYGQAFKELTASPELKAFMLTGDDAGVDLACLVEINSLCNLARQELSDLIQNYPALARLNNSPVDSLELITELEDAVLSKLNNNSNPSSILKYTVKQLSSIKSALESNIEAVKNSSIESKNIIIIAFEAVCLAIANFFRFVFGYKPIYKPVTVLENARQNIMAARHHPKIATEWSVLDDLIADIIQDNPAKKNQTFIIKKDADSALKHDYLYHGSSAANAPTTYRISRKLGKNGNKHAFLQNRAGERAVMKVHLVRSEDAPTTALSKELDCLAKMGRLIGQGYIYDNEQFSHHCISLQKHLPGKTLQDYVIQNDAGLFVKNKLLTKNKKIQLAIAIATGLKNTLEMGIIHGDIRPDKIMIQEKTGPNITSTLIGFGALQTAGNPDIMGIYAAPELLKATQGGDEEETTQLYPYSDKSDIYSLGIILKDLDIDPAITDKLTQENPDERPNITEVINLLSEQLNIVEENVADSHSTPEHTSSNRMAQ